MHVTLKNIPTFYEKAKAEKMISELNSCEYDDWTYKATEPNSEGKVKIEVYDEENEFVGNM